MNIPTPEMIARALDQAIAEMLTSDLEKILAAREIGHCLQVTDLPSSLMVRVAHSLRERKNNAEVYVLTNDTPRDGEITSTRLVARRNAGEAVILVFLPPELRTSAEDSFDVSTFERVPLENLYRRLRRQLEDGLAVKYQALAKEIIREAVYDSDVAVCRYLLAARAMKISVQALGLALPYLGLVPDRALPDEPRPRLDANKSAVRTLTNPRASLFEKIQELGLKAGRTPNALYRLFQDSGTLDPTRWLFKILDDAFVGDLTFDQWEFARMTHGQIDQILIKVTPLQRERDQEYPIFRAQQEKALKITWETVPPPLQCDGLNYFTVELMQDDAPATEARTTKVGTSNRKERSTTFKDVTKYDLEEGLYYARVSAWGEGGRLIKDAKSESFFIESIPVDADGDRAEQDSTSRRVIVTSIYEAKLRTQVNLRARDKDVAEIVPTYQWVTPERRLGGRYTDEFTITFNSDNQYVLPINALLRRHEHETLRDAENLGRWQLDLTVPRSAAITPELQEFRELQIERLEKFLDLRRALFEKIRSNRSNEIELLVETTDVLPLANEILDYARAYFDALRQLHREMETASPPVRAALLNANAQLTNIDTIQLQLPEGQTAALMAPTHPLKLLWILQYARATAKWQTQILEQLKTQVTWSAFDSFVPRLMSLNLPNALRDGNGNTLINAENMGPFWSIFVPAETRDVRTMVGRIKTLLGSPELDERFTTITGEDLARKILGYLDQHPYITTLILNAVQPGSGAILQELLLALETKREGLSYKLHLFAADFDPEELGAALDEMMSPLEKHSGSDALDAFVTPSGNALFPKLVYSKHRLAEFFTHPNDFEAHVTFLFDAFTVQIEFAPPMPKRRSNYLYGLVNQYASRFGSDETQVAWQRQVLLRRGVDVDDEMPGHATLIELANQYNALLNTFAQNQLAASLMLTLCLDLGAQDKNLVSQAHQISDWVLTVDPNFGIEYLDSPYDERCAAYLIDYQPEYLGAVGHRLIVSTQHLYEIEQIVQPVLESLALPHDTDEIREFVNALRSVSGRLVLKLISSPQMAHAALGMAAARLFLERAGLLQDMVLIPLDSHPDLFVAARREAELLGQTLSLRRTDMALVEMDPRTRELVFHLIEVKFRTQARDSTQRDLENEIAAQLENSAQAIQQLYDPELRDTDRMDRLVRTQELATLLDFYLERAERYRLIPSANLEPLRALLENLEEGYRLRITRAGIIFNLQAQGYRTEVQGDVHFHFLGSDILQQLVADARALTLTGKRPKPAAVFAPTRKTFTPRAAQVEYPAEPEIIPSTPEGVIESKPEPEADVEPIAPTPILVSSIDSKLECDVLLGTRKPSRQFGLLGRVGSRSVGLDLNGTNVISLFGVPGSGKSYTLGNILEMAVMPIAGINQLPQPLGAVVFHYDKETYKPEFVTMGDANEGSEANQLRELYGATPQGLANILMLVPEAKVAQRQKEFPNITVHPILFDPSELDLEDWKFLMGVVGSDRLYIRKMEQVFRKLRDKLNINALLQGVASANMNATQFDLAKTRLNFAKEFIRDGHSLRTMLEPGRLIIVDLRDELVEKDQALGLFVVMLKILSSARFQGRTFNKLIVFDEAHKYLGTELAKEVQTVVSQMRHLGTTVLIASQAPPSVPTEIIELSSQIILHKFNSPHWLQHIQKSNIALKELSPGRLNMLGKGQAYIWSSEATDALFTTRAVQIEMRPRATKHGGGTITALT